MAGLSPFAHPPTFALLCLPERLDGLLAALGRARLGEVSGPSWPLHGHRVAAECRSLFPPSLHSQCGWHAGAAVAVEHAAAGPCQQGCESQPPSAGVVEVPVASSLVSGGGCCALLPVPCAHWLQMLRALPPWEGPQRAKLQGPRPGG
eukprot:4424310-Amphidinium_carterae.3